MNWFVFAVTFVTILALSGFFCGGSSNQNKPPYLDDKGDDMSDEIMGWGARHNGDDYYDF